MNAKQDSGKVLVFSQLNRILLVECFGYFAEHLQDSFVDDTRCRVLEVYAVDCKTPCPTSTDRPECRINSRCEMVKMIPRVTLYPCCEARCSADGFDLTMY